METTFPQRSTTTKWEVPPRLARGVQAGDLRPRRCSGLGGRPGRLTDQLGALVEIGGAQQSHDRLVHEGRVAEVAGRGRSA